MGAEVYFVCFVGCLVACENFYSKNRDNYRGRRYRINASWIATTIILVRSANARKKHKQTKNPSIMEFFSSTVPFNFQRHQDNGQADKGYSILH